ncbi:carbamoyl phosphate synthase preATP-grasp domain-containing protein [Fructobacillus ficulneus]|uniref:carbamoyl-phosphate synthase (ammonia) n=1 Tax=Fructobacillus ficulneus TaxID=157463 RepID=A0A0K8MJ41_9LACO|nr:ATP-grasp domain-containing protein [Fructobacillus ficulneus]GAP00199.1 carbamoyl-phosphate synthase large chain [Fructobacillus ficulneus]
MYKKIVEKPIENILFIGGGETDFGLQGESDAAIYQVLPILNSLGYTTSVIDDNPYSLAIESPATTGFLRPLTVENVKAVLAEQNIDAVLPTFGGTRALRLWDQVLAEWRPENGPVPTSLGLKPSQLHQVNDGRLLFDRIIDAGLNVTASAVVKNQEEASELLREMELPLVVRAHQPIQTTTRQIIDRLDDFDQVVSQVMGQSLTHEVSIAKAINGLKEISVLVLRDRDGNCLKVGSSEDMDPIGIHSADSLSVAPVLTVSDQVLQQMRAQSFLIANLLGLQGVLHVQFAFNEKTGDIYVIKVSPYLDQLTNRMAVMTGYPVMLVAAQLAVGKLLTEVVLPNAFHAKTAIMEPVMDHIVVKLPVFSFGDMEATGTQVSRQLNSVQKSVGSALGFGRTFVEAMEKAIRSAHFNNRSFAPKYMADVSDDELIQQLIHPQDNRVLLLIEALRRGYEVDELAELTNIDEFYFYQLKRLLAIELSVDQQPGDAEALKMAKKSGLSDGLLARFWRTDFQSIRQLARANDIIPTYKALEPSAGEFPEHARQFFATFEEENESNPVCDRSVVIIGPGAFRMGDGASAGYMTSVTLSELHRLKYKTIIMNNNAADPTLLPHLSDKQYLEPLETSDVMSVIDRENPHAVLVPGNRKKLIAALEDLGQNVIVFPKEKHHPAGPEFSQSEFVLNLFYDGKDKFPLIIFQHQPGQIRLLDQEINPNFLAGLDLQSPGLYQVIWRVDINQWVSQVDLPNLSIDTWLRPMPYGHIAYLTKVLKMPLGRMVVRAWIGQLNAADRQLLAEVNTNPNFERLALMASATDYALHWKPDHWVDTTRFEMGARIAPYADEEG